MRRVTVSLIAVLLLVVPSLVLAQGPDIGPVPSPALTGEWVAGLIYVLLLVAIEYIPQFAFWWDGFEHKRSVVALAGLLAVIALVGLHYAGAFDLEIGPFTWAVVGEAFNAWLAFLGGSWLIWSLLERAGALPRKQPNEWIDEDGDGGLMITGGE